jgi:serine/threonine-protein kinase RsbW
MTVTSPAAQAATRYQRTFHGRADQIRQVRADITAHLGDCPAAADTVLIASEIAANAVLHSASSGEFFTIRCERHAGYIWLEVEDLGGPWHPGRPGDRAHGLDIVTLLTGPGNWGTETASDGNRIVWARLDLLPGEGAVR